MYVFRDNLIVVQAELQWALVAYFSSVSYFFAVFSVYEVFVYLICIRLPCACWPTGSHAPQYAGYLKVCIEAFLRAKLVGYTQIHYGYTYTVVAQNILSTFVRVSYECT